MSTESNEGEPDCAEQEHEKAVKHSECLVCGKKLDCSMEFDGCTVWRTYGNYGSVEFDPMSENLVCEVVICDECLNKKASVVRVVRRIEVQKIVDDSSFEDWKKLIKELTARGISHRM